MAALVLFVLVLLASVGGHDGASLELRGIINDHLCHERAADAPPQGLMDMMSSSGCGSFAGLLTETPNAREVFRQRLGGGLTVFCPDDKAVAAFDPTLRALAEHDQLDVLLHLGTAARYARATNRSQTIIVALGQDGRLEGRARITRTVSSELGAPSLVVHVVDAVLLPRRVRQKLDGEDDEAVICRAAARVLAGSGCTDATKIKETTTKKPETLF